MARELEAWLSVEAAKLGVSSAHFDVLLGDHGKVLMPWVADSVPPRGGLGLLLHDPNGAPDLRLLQRFASEPQLSRFDIAIYLQATPLKRVRGLPQQYDTSNWEPLDQAMPKVKAHWVVRDPTGSNQYALCIGSNNALPGTWTRQRFWPTDSDRGRAIFDGLKP